MKVTHSILAVGVALVALVGCENGVQNMYDQAKYKPQAASELWPDGRAARPLPVGTVAFSGGPLADTSSGRAERRAAEGGAPGGEQALGAATGAGAEAAIYSAAALARGRDRYSIFCVPCHGAAGDGDGYITRRGFPHPPTFHADRLRGAPDQYLFDVVSRGYGAMYPYADRITPQDRWAIVGYVRALQRSQHASLEDLPVSERNRQMPPAGAQ
jgi:mono/diheme cytochrome c family protein